MNTTRMHLYGILNGVYAVHIQMLIILYNKLSLF